MFKNIDIRRLFVWVEKMGRKDKVDYDYTMNYNYFRNSLLGLGCRAYI